MAVLLALVASIAVVQMPALARGDTASPGPITDLVASAATKTTITLSWTRPADADFAGVLIRQSTGKVAPTSITDGRRAASVAAAADSVMITGLAPGSSYSFAAFAYDTVPNYAAAADLTAVQTDPLHWHPSERLDPMLGQPNDVSCPDATFCMVVDATGHAVPWTHGTRGAAIDVGPSLMSVSCPTKSFCMADDSEGRVFRYRGGVWRRMQSYLPGRDPSVSCVSATFCVRVSKSVTSRYNGTRWTRPTRIATATTRLTDVSCTSRAFCVAVGVANSTRSTDRWIGRAYTWDGRTWSGPRMLARYVIVGSVSCTSPSFCMAGADDGQTFRWDGRRWDSIHDHLRSIRHVRGISCVSRQFCVEIASTPPTVKAAVFDGTSWHPGRRLLTTGSRSGAAVACATARSCLVVDRYGDSRRWIGRWARAPHVVDRTEGNLSSVSCATPKLCIAVDEFANYLVHRSGRWSRPQRISPWAQGVTDIECVAPAFCMTVDSASRTWLYTGARWHRGPKATINYAWSNLTSTGQLSCGSRTFCMLAVDGRASIFNGQFWSRPVRYNRRNDQEWGVSCTAARFCAVLELGFGEARLFPFRRGAWATPKAFSTQFGPPSISCVGMGWCMLPDGVGHVRIYQGGAVDAVRRPAASGWETSCVSRAFCVLDDVDTYYVWNGTKFDHALPLTSDPVTDEIDISCVAPAYCAAIGEGGAVIGS